VVSSLGGDAFRVGAPMSKPATLFRLFKGTRSTGFPSVANAALGSGLDGSAWGAIEIFMV